MKRSRSEAVRAALLSYLERRNYTEYVKSDGALCMSAEQMAVAAIVDGESGRANSVLFSCINSDPHQCDRQFTKLAAYIKTVEPGGVQQELSNLLCPLLCHMYLEMLRGGHRNPAQIFLKRQSAHLPHKDFDSAYYDHQTSDGNLPSALYRPSSLEQLFHSLQNGTIDNDAPEKDFVYRVLEELGGVSSLQEVDSRPSLAAFRSCKFQLQMSHDAVSRLRRYLAKHGHVVLIQLLQTWFHFDIVSKDPADQNSVDLPEDDDDSEDAPNNSDFNDGGRLCNGHADFMENENELRELREAVRRVRESAPPLKLYAVSTAEASLSCATLDSASKNLYCGFSDSEIRIWKIGGDEAANERRSIRGNVSHVRLACDDIDDENAIQERSFDPSEGACLRGHSGSVQALRLIESADVLVSASRDAGVRAWRLSDGSCAAIYRGHNYPIWCLDVAKHGVHMATGSMDRTAKLWSLDRTFPLRIFAGHNLDVNTVCFHPNGNYLATGSADKTVRLWCVSTGQQVRLFPGHRGPVYSVAFSPDGKSIASAGEDKRVKIWDIANGTCLHDLKGHQSAITHLEWSPTDDGFFDGPKSGDAGALLSTGADSTVRLWDSHFYKSGSNSDSSPAAFDCKCLHVVTSHYGPDWLSAVGSKKS